MPRLRNTQVRKAARLLTQVIDLLETCGSKAAFKRGFDSVEQASSQQGAHQQLAKSRF